MLGELISHLRGSTYEEVVKAELFEPLSMNDSAILKRWPSSAPCGYVLRDHSVIAADQKVPSVPAAGGLYSTAADIGRFLANWRSLLPEDLAKAAILGFRASSMWNTDTNNATVVLVNSESDGLEDLSRRLLVAT